MSGLPIWLSTTSMSRGQKIESDFLEPKLQIILGTKPSSTTRNNHWETAQAPLFSIFRWAGPVIIDFFCFNLLGNFQVTFLFYVWIKFIFILCMCVLSTCMSASHAFHCPQVREGILSLGTGMIDSYIVPRECWELNPRSPRRADSALNQWQYLQVCSCPRETRCRSEPRLPRY